MNLLEKNFKLYYLDVGFVYNSQEDGKLLEYGFSNIIKCDSNEKACFAGFVWLRDRIKNLENIFQNARPGYVKVGRYFSGYFHFDEKNAEILPSKRCMFFYEWKMDRKPFDSEFVRLLKNINK